MVVEAAVEVFLAVPSVVAPRNVLVFAPAKKCESTFAEEWDCLES